MTCDAGRGSGGDGASPLRSALANLTAGGTGKQLGNTQGPLAPRNAPLRR